MKRKTLSALVVLFVGLTLIWLATRGPSEEEVVRAELYGIWAYYVTTAAPPMTEGVPQRYWVFDWSSRGMSRRIRELLRETSDSNDANYTALLEIAKLYEDAALITSDLIANETPIEESSDELRLVFELIDQGELKIREFMGDPNKPLDEYAR